MTRNEIEAKFDKDLEAAKNMKGIQTATDNKNIALCGLLSVGDAVMFDDAFGGDTLAEVVGFNLGKNCAGHKGSVIVEIVEIENEERSCSNVGEETSVLVSNVTAI